jgi:hypothetical protein
LGEKDSADSITMRVGEEQQQNILPEGRYYREERGAIAGEQGKASTAPDLTTKVPILPPRSDPFVAANFTGAKI